MKVLFDYPDLRVEFFPPKSTHKYQPLGLGLMAHGKIRYRTLLLSQVVNYLLHWASGNMMFLNLQIKGNMTSSMVIFFM